MIGRSFVYVTRHFPKAREQKVQGSMIQLRGLGVDRTDR